MIRRAAFEWLGEQVELLGDVLHWSVLIRGFTFRGNRVPLVSMQGIFKPRIMELPLAIRTAAASPYSDRESDEGRFLYAYRGTDPGHAENVGLRELMQRRIPLVYLFGLMKGRYLPAWPVFVVGDDPDARLFTIQLEDVAWLRAIGRAEAGDEAIGEDREDDIRRRYLTRELRIRLHQRSFRERVLHAYREECALCRLRHRELLDAAHIVADVDPEGEPKVSNGLALCKLHHAAFDRRLFGIRPDYFVRVRRDILDEDDGPMLIHGLKELHEQRIEIPRSPRARPDPALLERRFEEFCRLFE